ncbi:hypothetical protein OZN62_04605 [Aurantiacibacter sp. MUD11]|uniref:hypothetical protein n=1 Tax=Aurantiacibacter sp. MUD11 TaxID=3003265 RepID=UPI0022AB12ED|nr:hypothetical protein [Aurantiacibacter sp. MUD11]WAT18855.1 hypothetical protein OZN62_04605 [Aurantiacibacter sp. MUD11]
MKLKFATAVLAASVGLSGCATVLNGVNQPVEFQSDPDGAVIELYSGQSCTTPCSFEMRRGDDNIVTFSRDGYQDVEVMIQSRTGGGVAGNLLAGGIIGGVVDASNGASNHLYPDPVYVRMVPVGENGEALLLDKDGEVISTVAEYNAEVEADVREGLVDQGLVAGAADEED